MKKSLPFLVLILFLFALFVGIYFNNQSVKNIRSKASLSTQNSMSLPDIQTIKSIAYAFPSNYEEPWQTFPKNITKIRSMGFNTVWFIMPWAKYEKKALPVPEYNEYNFTKLKETLTLLKRNNMKAILPLNYIWSTPGLYPEGIDSKKWLSDPIQYKAFENYVQEFLTRISSFNDSVYILLFTEGAENNINNYDFNNLDTNLRLAAMLRTTLGSLPLRLPKELRSKFRIGYHDGGYLIANLGLNFSTELSPLDTSIPFDFFSFANYDTNLFNGYDVKWIISRLDQQLIRAKKAYPNTHIIVGEFGGTSCYGQDRQASTDKELISYAINHNMGFGLWGWQSLGDKQTCSSNSAEYGLGINTVDEVPKKAVVEIKSLLLPFTKPSIVSAGISTGHNPWAIWVRGINFTPRLTAQINENVLKWRSNIPIIISGDGTWLSFYLPSNNPPSKCNEKVTCSVKVSLFDPDSNYESNIFEVVLPATSPIANVNPPSISNGGVNISLQPWAIWLIGKNFSREMKVSIFDGEMKWGEDVPFVLSADLAWGSFYLPSNNPPSKCNEKANCNISVIVTNKLTNQSSKSYTLSLPTYNN